MATCKNETKFMSNFEFYNLTLIIMKNLFLNIAGSILLVLLSFYISSKTGPDCNHRSNKAGLEIVYKYDFRNAQLSEKVQNEFNNFKNQINKEQYIKKQIETYNFQNFSRQIGQNGNEKNKNTSFDLCAKWESYELYNKSNYCRYLAGL